MGGRGGPFFSLKKFPNFNQRRLKSWIIVDDSKYIHTYVANMRLERLAANIEEPECHASSLLGPLDTFFKHLQPIRSHMHSFITLNN